jgi:hypothetical protein
MTRGLLAVSRLAGLQEKGTLAALAPICSSLNTLLGKDTASESGKNTMTVGASTVTIALMIAIGK